MPEEKKKNQNSQDKVQNSDNKINKREGSENAKENNQSASNTNSNNSGNKGKEKESNSSKSEESEVSSKKNNPSPKGSLKNPVDTKGIVMKFIEWLRRYIKYVSTEIGYLDWAIAYTVAVLIIYISFALWIFILNIAGGGDNFSTRHDGYSLFRVNTTSFLENSGGPTISALSQPGQTTEWLYSGYKTDGSPMEIYVNGKIYHWGEENTSYDYEYKESLDISDTTSIIKKKYNTELVRKKCNFTTDYMYCEKNDNECKLNQLERYNNPANLSVMDLISSTGITKTTSTSTDTVDGVCLIYYQKYYNNENLSGITYISDYNTYFAYGYKYKSKSWCSNSISTNGSGNTYYNPTSTINDDLDLPIKFYGTTLVIPKDPNNTLSKNYHIDYKCIKNFIFNQNNSYKDISIDTVNCTQSSNRCLYIDPFCIANNSCNHSTCQTGDISIYPSDENYSLYKKTITTSITANNNPDCFSDTSKEITNTSCLSQKTGSCSYGNGQSILCNINSKVDLYANIASSSENGTKIPISSQFSFIKDVNCKDDSNGEKCKDISGMDFETIDSCYFDNGYGLYMKIGDYSNYAYHVVNLPVENKKMVLDTLTNTSSISSLPVTKKPTYVEKIDEKIPYKMIPFSLPTKKLNINRKDTIINNYSRIDKDLIGVDEYSTGKTEFSLSSSCEQTDFLLKPSENCSPIKNQKIYFKILTSYYKDMTGYYDVNFQSGAIKDENVDDPNGFRPFSMTYDLVSAIFFGSGQDSYMEKGSYSSYYDKVGKFSQQCSMKLDPDTNNLVPDSDRCFEVKVKISEDKGSDGLFYKINKMFSMNNGIQLLKFILLIHLIILHGYNTIFASYDSKDAAKIIEEIVQKMIRIGIVIWITDPSNSYFLTKIVGRFFYSALPNLGSMIVKTGTDGIFSWISTSNPYVMLDEMITRVIFSTEPHAKIAAIIFGTRTGNIIAIILPVFYFMFISFMLIVIRIAFGFMMSLLVLGIITAFYPIIAVLSLYDKFKDGISTMIKMAIQAVVIVSFRVVLSMIFVSFIYNEYREMFNFAVKWDTAMDFSTSPVFFLFRIFSLKAWIINNTFESNIIAIGSASPGSTAHFLLHMMLYFTFLIFGLFFMDKIEKVFDFINDNKNEILKKMLNAREVGGALAEGFVDKTLLAAMGAIEKTTTLRLEGLKSLRNPIKSVASLRIGKKRDKKEDSKKPTKEINQKPTINNSNTKKNENKTPIEKKNDKNKDLEKPTIDSASAQRKNKDLEKPTIDSANAQRKNKDLEKPTIDSASAQRKDSIEKSSLSSSSLSYSSEILINHAANVASDVKFNKTIKEIIEKNKNTFKNEPEFFKTIEKIYERTKNIDNIIKKYELDYINKPEKKPTENQKEKRVDSSLLQMEGEGLSSLNIDQSKSLSIESSLGKGIESGLDPINKEQNNDRIEKEMEEKEKKERDKIQSNIKDVEQNIKKIKEIFGKKESELSKYTEKIQEIEKKIRTKQIEQKTELDMSKKDNIEIEITNLKGERIVLENTINSTTEQISLLDQLTKSFETKLSSFESRMNDIPV